MMDSAYGMGLLIYGVAALILLVLLGFVILRIQALWLRWTLLWTLAVVLFFPWFSDELSGHIAPNVIVAAFALLDTGVRPALELMQWQWMVWLGGSLVLSSVAFIMRSRKPSDEPVD